MRFLLRHNCLHEKDIFKKLLFLYEIMNIDANVPKLCHFTSPIRDDL